MISLRHKLWLGYGGLVAVLLAVSVLSAVVLVWFSHALERMFRENYDSAVYCDGMKDCLDQLDARAQHLLWEEDGGRVDAAGEADAAAQEARFDDDLAQQFRNCSLPGETEQTRLLAGLWDTFKARYRQFDADPARRRDLYRLELLPLAQEMKQVAQRVAAMNMTNMVSVDGRVKRTLTGVRNALLVLVAAGTLLASVVVWTAGAAILRTLRALTESARRIEAGDLDLSLPVRSRDEIGQLSDAFNAMAARLREFRTLDRDRLVRTQQTTQLAVDSLPDAVFVVGPAGRVEISNRAARAYFGIEPGSVVSDLRLRWLTPLYESVRRTASRSSRGGTRRRSSSSRTGRSGSCCPAPCLCWARAGT